MDEFRKLLEILDRLLAPDGCPWDQKQTMETIRSTVLEEVHELIDAIDENDDEKIVEELGDLFLNAAFFCKLGEKDSRFFTEQVLRTVNEKLIRRHPHVFGSAVAGTKHEAMVQWESIKREEKGNRHRKSSLDGIPKGLPSLAKAQKLLKILYKKKLQFTDLSNLSDYENNQERISSELLRLVDEAEQRGIDIELSLKKTLAEIEKNFRLQEISGGTDEA